MNDQVQDAEIVEEVKTESPVESDPEVSSETPDIEIAPQDPEKKEYTVRTEETGDKVYFVREEKRYWVKNPETLKKLGFSLGNEKKIPFSELLKLSEGEPIDLTVPDFIFPWDRPETPVSESPTTPYRIWQ